MRVGGVERLLVQDVDRADGRAPLVQAPAHHRVGELERAVLDQLAVKPAVGAEVDILEEDAVQGGTDLCARPVGPND